MKEFYCQRFRWIFDYTSNNFWYVLAKTFCIIIGAPIYFIVFAIEMVLTFVNMILSWIPIIGVLVTIICKGITLLIDKLFFISILTDIGKYKKEVTKQPDYKFVEETKSNTEQSQD